jgi:SAM-dependent methyltransferase
MSDSPWKNDEFAGISLNSIDKQFTPGTTQEVDFLERELNLTLGSRVLDIGCGAGRHSVELTRRGHRVVGVDISPIMLQAATDRAHEAGVDVLFSQIDINELEQHFTETEQFDAALCLCESGLGVLGGDVQDFSFLQTVRRLLRPGAGFAITAFNAIRKYRNPGQVFDYTTGVVHWEAPVEGATLREDQRIYTPSELTMLLHLSGFADIRIYGCAPGNFSRRKLEVNDIEMMLIAGTPGILNP